jgi:hypothetical protein
VVGASSGTSAAAEARVLFLGGMRDERPTPRWMAYGTVREDMLLLLRPSTAAAAAASTKHPHHAARPRMCCLNALPGPQFPCPVLAIISRRVRAQA